LSGWNLGNKRIRKLYIAVTGKKIQNEAFWPHFKESVKRRNRAVHSKSGETMTKAEAESSYKAASDLVAYLK
jgi:hypothetical protein